MFFPNDSPTVDRQGMYHFKVAMQHTGRPLLVEQCGAFMCRRIGDREGVGGRGGRVLSGGRVVKKTRLQIKQGR